MIPVISPRGIDLKKKYIPPFFFLDSPPGRCIRQKKDPLYGGKLEVFYGILQNLVVQYHSTQFQAKQEYSFVSPTPSHKSVLLYIMYD